MNVQKIFEKLGEVPQHPILRNESIPTPGSAACLLAVERFTGSQAAERVGLAIGLFGMIRFGYAVYDTLSPSESGPAPSLPDTIAAHWIAESVGLREPEHPAAA